MGLVRAFFSVCRNVKGCCDQRGCSPQRSVIKHRFPSLLCDAGSARSHIPYSLASSEAMSANGSTTPKAVGVAKINLQEVFDTAKVKEEWAKVFLEALGADGDADPESIAEIPDEVVDPLILSLERSVEGDTKQKIKPIEIGQLRVFMKKLRGSVAGDAPPTKEAPSEQTKDVDIKGKKRMAEVLDQMDDGHYEPLTESERMQYNQNYVDVTGGEPSLETKASTDQIAALKSRLTSGRAPYVDFAVFVPHGKRFAKIRKFDAQVFVNNSLQQRVLRGPGNYASWVDSWNVFRTAMLSLKAASPQVLDDYQRGIFSLVQIHPEAWGLVYAADEVMRSEVWDDMRDELVTEGRWPSMHPWNLVIKLSTFGCASGKRSHWWYLHVLAPAQKGGKELIKSLEGTSLVPSPDGMFGGTVSTSVAPTAAAAIQHRTGNKARANRRNRDARKDKMNEVNGDRSGHPQTGGGSSSWQGGFPSEGKGAFSKGKGKGDKGSKGGKGKKGGKAPTK